jgi:hypothetical protein
MSKSSFLGAVLVLGSAGIIAAQDTKPAPATPPNANEPVPSIVKRKENATPAPVVTKTSNARLVIPETDFRFGYAPQNAKIAHNYWLKNEGPDSLRLIDVRPGCGCTKAPLTKRILAAGDSTNVELVFSTGMYSSKTQKSATVVADANQTVPNLTFSAFPTKNVDSLKPFIVMPPLVNLDSLKDAGKSGSVEVRVKNTSTSPINLKLVSTPDKWFTVEVPGGSIAPGSDEVISVRFTSDIADTVLTKSFTIEASDSALTRYSVPIQKAMRWGPTTSSTP